MRTVLLINTHSRNGRRYVKRVLEDFQKAPDFELIKTLVIEDLASVKTTLKTLSETPDLECVIIGSGDGTIVSVLNTLKDRDITYGILPLGTSNTFARSLGLPLTYPAAKRAILKRQTKPAHLGTVNGVLFANIAGIGVPAEVTRLTTNKVKKILGPLAYLMTGIRTILIHTAFNCQVTGKDINESFKTHYLIFANGKYHGNLPLDKDISVYKDQLMLMAVGVNENRWHHIAAIFSVLLRRHKNDDRVLMLPFEKIEITTQPRQAIEADGEIISRTPATIEIRKNAITIFAKPPSPLDRYRRTPS